MTSPLDELDLQKKIKLFKNLQIKNTNWSVFEVPKFPGRDLEILTTSKLPKKKGLSYLAGKQRLLHDLASIELQAMELGLRTLIEFSNKKNIPQEFLKDLELITLEESLHCKMCVETLEMYQGEWGMFPTHVGLWAVAQENDTILERLLKVHRYLEGSGMDATFSMLRRLDRVDDSEPLKDLIHKIATDEIRHVQFGSKWFKYFCEMKNLSRVQECKRILKENSRILPRRREKINLELRKKTGFLDEEILVFQKFQETTFVS